MQTTWYTLSDSSHLPPHHESTTMKQNRFFKNEFNLSRNNVLILQMSTFGFQFTKTMSVQLVKWSTPPSVPRPLDEVGLPRVCVQKLAEFRMTQEQKWLVQPSVLHAYYHTKCGDVEGMSLQTGTLPLTFTACIEQNAILKVGGLYSLLL